MSALLRTFSCFTTVYQNICNLRGQLKHHHLSLQYAPLMTTITVEELTGFFNLYFSVHHLSQHVSSLTLSSGDKQERSDNTNYMIVEFPTHVNTYIRLGELWWNVVRTEQVLLYSSVNGNIAHIEVQLQHSDRFSSCVLLYWLYKLYCSGRLEEVHKGNDCSYTIGTEMVLQWHSLLKNVLCSTAIDCCSAFRHKLLSKERSVA